MTLRNRVLVGWKIWYGDGTTISSKQSSWEDCEQKNVQVVKMFYMGDNGLEVNTHHNQEFYLLNDLLQVPKAIKLGKAIEGYKFYEILHNAEQDQEIPVEGIPN